MARRTLNRTIAITGMYEPSHRSATTTFFLSPSFSLFAAAGERQKIERGALYGHDGLVFAKRLSVRPIKHGDHVRIVRSAASDTVLPVLLMADISDWLLLHVVFSSFDQR